MRRLEMRDSTWCVWLATIDGLSCGQAGLQDRIGLAALLRSRRGKTHED